MAEDVRMLQDILGDCKPSHLITSIYPEAVCEGLMKDMFRYEELETIASTITMCEVIDLNQFMAGLKSCLEGLNISQLDLSVVWDETHFLIPDFFPLSPDASDAGTDDEEATESVLARQQRIMETALAVCFAAENMEFFALDLARSSASLQIIKLSFRMAYDSLENDLNLEWRAVRDVDGEVCLKSV